jgi:hypothetical protein
MILWAEKCSHIFKMRQFTIGTSQASLLTHCYAPLFPLWRVISIWKGYHRYSSDMAADTMHRIPRSQNYAYARNSWPVMRHRVILRSFDEVIWWGEEIFVCANICVVVLECLAYCRICVWRLTWWWNLLLNKTQLKEKREKQKQRTPWAKKRVCREGARRGKGTRQTGIDAGIEIVERLFAGLAHVRFTGITCLKRRSSL